MTRKDIKSAIWALVFVSYAFWAIEVGTPVYEHGKESIQKITQQ